MSHSDETHDGRDLFAITTVVARPTSCSCGVVRMPWVSGMPWRRRSVFGSPVEELQRLQFSAIWGVVDEMPAQRAGRPPAVSQVLLRCTHLLCNLRGVQAAAEAQIASLVARALTELDQER